MGLCFDKASVPLDEGSVEHARDLIPFRSTGSKVRVMICALDYNYSPGHELTSHLDGALMVRVARHAECTDITSVTDNRISDPNFPVRQRVLDQIREVGSRCQPGDWFVFFWAGHGVNVPDVDGEEADGLDEAFVCPDHKGRLTERGVLVDDDFCRALDKFIPLGVRILCICDCCHSGTICDIDTFAYRHDIYQVSASQDDEEAEDTGKGGLLAWGLKRTLIKLGFTHGYSEFSIAQVFDGCKRKVKSVTTEQTVSVQYSGPPPQTVAWPLFFPVWKWAEKVPDDLQDFETYEGK